MRNLILMVFLVTSLNGSAAVITWTNGNTTNLWSDPLNWSSGTIPGAADVATFNATSVANCNLDVVANVAGFNIQAGYTGIITQNAGITITIGSSNFSQAGGTFTGGNSNIDINSGSFSLSGGSFLSTTATLFVGGTFSANTTLFTHTAGTFTHNNGEVEFDPYRASCTQTTFTVDVLTSTQFYDVEINGSQSCGVSAVLTTAAGDTLDAAHDFIHTNGYLNGMWELKNDLYIGASSDGGLGQIIFNSTVGQQYSVNAAAPRTCTIVIDKTAGAVTPAGGTTDFSMQAFILNQGSFTAPTGTMKIGGTFSANTTLFTHTAGTFTHNNGEV
ncbi:MAG: hypothetical protein KDC84_15845, partial [Crocinitomicaceae bacterium]|nr:hypothetical protein [Crocinitomicaceae bacterium]